MERRVTTRLGAALTAVLLVACGGVTTRDPGEPSGSGGGGAGAAGASGGTGGVAPSSGGAAPLLRDCTNPVAAGTACSEPSARCGGPCSNSWQVENVCKDGTWGYGRVVACGPNASRAPQCRNSFGGGELTPCCPEAELDCTGKPDGYPGFGCTPGDGSFCSCTCFEGMSQCGC